MEDLMKKVDALYQEAKDKYESMKNTEVSGYYNGRVVGIGEVAKIIMAQQQDSPDCRYCEQWRDMHDGIYKFCPECGKKLHG